MTVYIQVFHRLSKPVFYIIRWRSCIDTNHVWEIRKPQRHLLHARHTADMVVLEEMQMLISICVLHDLPQGISKEKSYNLTFCYKFLNKTLKNQLSFSLRMFASLIFKHKMKVGKILPSKYNKQC